jgi:hypothetical protein
MTDQGELFPEGEALRCSNEGAEILGTVVVVASNGDDEDMAWGERRTYQGSEKEFVLLHPKCFHDLVDEILRAESMAAILVSLGPVDDLREALQM